MKKYNSFTHVNVDKSSSKNSGKGGDVDMQIWFERVNKEVNYGNDMINFDNMLKILKQLIEFQGLHDEIDNIFAKTLWNNLQTNKSLNYIHITRLRDYILDSRWCGGNTQAQKDTKIDKNKTFSYQNHINLPQNSLLQKPG